MANYLASIFGTEQDKVNCSFYYKIGACRHGDRCSRKHVKPSYSQTILLPNMYQNPAFDPRNKMTQTQLQNHFDAFYEDIWCELCKYGLVEEVVVCDNNNDHLIGNVYVRFKYEEDAQKACDDLNSRWYAARPIYCELSPVTDFREACCRLNSGEGCVRGGFCNFIHRKQPSAELEKELNLETLKWLKERGRDPRSVSRSPTPEPTRKRDEFGVEFVKPSGSYLVEVYRPRSPPPQHRRRGYGRGRRYRSAPPRSESSHGRLKRSQSSTPPLASPKVERECFVAPPPSPPEPQASCEREETASPERESPKPKRFRSESTRLDTPGPKTPPPYISVPYRDPSHLVIRGREEVKMEEVEPDWMSVTLPYRGRNRHDLERWY